MERKYNIDFVRTISALAVIIIHIVSAPITNITGTIDPVLENTLHTILVLMRWSVPVFFMITGYCLLLKEECTYSYCFRHIRRYILTLFSVGLFYALLEEVFTHRVFDFWILLNSIKNVISGNLWDHMWFVYSIMEIYLVMPVIHSFLQKGEQNALTFAGILFICTILLPEFEEYFSVGINLPISGYLFYVCYGGILAKYPPKKRTNLLVGIIGLISLIWLIFGVRYKEFGYGSLPVCIAASSTFWLVTGLNIKPNKILRNIADCTWGIYLIHPLFINVAVKVLRINFLTGWAYFKLTGFFLIVFACSFAATYILKKSPITKYIF